MLNYKDKKILVLGLKMSGLTVINLLNKQGIVPFASDKQLLEEDLMDLKYQFIYLPHDELPHKLNKIDFIIKSPGIPDHTELIKQAKDLQIPILSEVEVAYHFYDRSKVLIGVTGTNGKTTTTSLITTILTEANLKACSCGNIGYSFSDAVLKGDFDYYVCELSSFQLNNIDQFKPDIAVMLNISPNHLDYHQTFENYVAAKSKLLQNMREKNALIYYADDENLSEVGKHHESLDHITFSLRSDDHHCTYKNESIYYEGQKIIDSKKMQLLGLENISNVMAAICVAKRLNIRNQIIKKAIEQFKPLHYRIEYCDTINQVDYYNDSKSTNTKATICAVNALKGPIILILGGVHKEDDYEAIMCSNKIKYVICFGQNRDYVKQQADLYNKVCFVCLNLLEVMRLIKKMIKNGDQVLFSPAAQSFDLYENYEKRGDDFNHLIKTVIKF